MSDFFVLKWKKISITDLLSFFVFNTYILSTIFSRFSKNFFSFMNPFSNITSFIDFIVPATFLFIGLIAIKSNRLNYIAPIFLLYPLIECLVDLPIIIYWNITNNHINFGYINESVFLILMTLLLWRLLKRKPLVFEVSVQSIIFSLITTFVVLFYWIGRWLPWTKTNYLIRAEGFTWNKNGQKLSVESHNQITDTLTNAWGIAEILGVLFAIFFIILIAILKDQRLRSVLILILGSKSISLPLSSLLVPFETNPDQKIFGYTQEKIEELQLVITQSRGSGIWVCFLASILLLLTALFSAFFSQVQAPVRKKN